MKGKLLKIGITGGIGSGKTIVSKIFSLLGIPLYNADERAKWILANNEAVRVGLINLLGEEAFLHGSLNRAYISRQVFNDKQKLDKLNQLVHPQVALDFEHWLEGKEKYPYILKEAALLFEAGSYKYLDKIITVYAPAELRIQRLLERDPYRNEEGIHKIMNEQMDEEEKIKRADFVVYNDEKNMLIPQVVRLDETFRKIV